MYNQFHQGVMIGQDPEKRFIKIKRNYRLWLGKTNVQEKPSHRQALFRQNGGRL